jgi:DUF3048 family protein
MRPFRWLAIPLVFAVACTSSPSAQKGRSSPTPPPPPIAPLVGLTGKQNAPFTTRPALAVKIENTPDARPQSGLEGADIVYEELVEGGITRFIAIFQSSNARNLGPIRSVRPEDADILREYHAALAFSGGARYVISLIQGTPGIFMINETRGGTAYRRVRFRPSPHNLYSSTAALWARIGTRAGGPPAQYFQYAVTPPAITPTPSASPTASPSPTDIVRSGTRVAINYSSATYTARWRYDSVTKRYLRFEGTIPHRTASGKQLSAKNVLLMFVRTHESTHRDAAGNTTPIATMIGRGTVVLFRDGVRIVGKWSRPTAADRTTFTTTTGAPLLLAPGNTWIQLVPRGKKVTY